MGAAEHVERAVGIELQIHALVEDAAELDVVADGAAAQPAVLFRRLLARRKALRVAERDTLVHQAGELAAVVIPQGRRRVRACSADSGCGA
jgi:hypothetical protein